MFDYEKLAAAMGELDEDTMLAELNAVMADGGTEALQAMAACQEGLDTVGTLFERGEYFVGDLIYAGELMTEAVDMLKDSIAVTEGNEKVSGKIIICTVKDDLHDIGKNIVKSMLSANGFNVIDLGIDVSAGKIIEVAKAENVSVIALSGVLTLALDSMKAIVPQLREEIPGCKIIIGGAPVNEDACRLVGADEWAHSPQKTVQVCKGWLC